MAFLFGDWGGRGTTGRYIFETRAFTRGEGTRVRYFINCDGILLNSEK